MDNSGTLRISRFWESVLIGLGGALGALARHGLEAFQPGVSAGVVGFPWVTLGINTAGAFLLGWVLAWSATRRGAPGWVRPFAGFGFCGAFTTFSTVTCELVVFAQAGDVVMAAVYLGASVVLGILAAEAGERLAAGGGRG